MFSETCFLQLLLTILERKNAGLSHTKAREKAFMIQNARISVIPKFSQGKFNHGISDNS
jgi:hypothetical protein